MDIYTKYAYGFAAFCGVLVVTLLYLSIRNVFTVYSEDEKTEEELSDK